MSGNDNSISSTNGTPNLSYLTLTIIPTPNSLVIKATFTNNHPTATFSILSWDTPLSPVSFSQGIFSIYRLGDKNNKMLGRQIKYRRYLPPPRSHIVEIGPRDSSTQELKIPIKDYPLESGQRYRIRAAGRYYTVWPLKREEITDKELTSLGGKRRCSPGRFESNEAEFVAP